ncbi:MAG: mechanosensitive ion channel family protein [Gemmatimonadetes bacterium]|jgi:small-conductance mechanosensitive channel|nr:mechanosensitive ion channel family protein [Gemmatimonadota bacterium]
MSSLAIQLKQSVATIDSALTVNIAATLVLLFGVALLRRFLVTRIRASSIKAPELRRRWLMQVRNGVFLIALLGLVAIWSQELQQLAISLLAILVALVLATKELILCLTGSLLKVRAGAFTVGDRIEVNGIKGDVIDQTLLTTRLAEIAPVGGAAQYTGRSLTLPNSLFLIHPIANGSVLDDFVLHTVVIPLAGDKDWRRAETSLLAAANEVCAPYMSEAQSQFDRHAQTYGLEGTELEPRVSIALPDPTRIDLQLRIATPARKTRRIEQQIVRSYLARAAADTPDPETDVNVPSN